MNFKHYKVMQVPPLLYGSETSFILRGCEIWTFDEKRTYTEGAQGCLRNTKWQWNGENYLLGRVTICTLHRECSVIIK